MATKLAEHYKAVLSDNMRYPLMRALAGVQEGEAILHRLKKALAEPDPFETEFLEIAEQVIDEIAGRHEVELAKNKINLKAESKNMLLNHEAELYKPSLASPGDFVYASAGALTLQFNESRYDWAMPNHEEEALRLAVEMVCALRNIVQDNLNEAAYDVIAPKYDF